MIEATSFWNLVDRRADATPDGLMWLDESLKTMTFSEFRDASERLAAGLFARGVAPGVSVSWVLPTRFDALLLMAALARLGAVQIPILPILGEREVDFMLKQTAASMIVVPGTYRDVDFKAMADKLGAHLPGLQVLLFDGDLPDGDPAGLPVAPAADTMDDVRWIFYTSGTTGDPKGARHSDRSILESSLGMARAMDLGPSDRIALVFPITHLGGANSMTAALCSGAGHLLVDSFFAPGVIDFLSAQGVTHAGAGTVFHQAYLREQRARGEQPLFPAIRVFQGGGAPKPPQLHYDLKKEVGGAGILSVYGMTECPIISLGRIDDPDEKLAQTEGKFNTSATEYKLIDPESGNQLRSDQEGELWLRAPQLLKGYVDEALNSDPSIFDKDGFFCTGDLVQLDAEGNISITGRVKDIIIRKGENIAPKEIEDPMVAHPKVAAIAVVGLKTDVGGRGELACAVVVPAGAERITLEEMGEHLHSLGLSRRKWPEQLEFLDALPMNATGKVLKKQLRARLAANLPDED